MLSLKALFWVTLQLHYLYIFQHSDRPSKNIFMNKWETKHARTTLPVPQDSQFQSNYMNLGHSLKVSILQILQ